MPSRKSQNLKFIKSRDEDFSLPASASEDSLQKMEAKNGQPTVRYTNSARPVFLHSFYNPSEEARNMVKKFAGTKIKVLIVFGLGLGYHLEELLEAAPAVSSVIVVESEPEIFEAALDTLDFEKLIGRRDLRVIVGSDPVLFRSRMTEAWESLGESEFLLFEHLPLKKLFLDYYAQAREIFISLQTGGQQDMDAVYEHRKTLQENILRNVRAIETSADFRALGGRFPGTTAFIVHKKNIDTLCAGLLADFSPKALIISSEQSLPALAGHGIRPHIVFCDTPGRNPLAQVDSAALLDGAAAVITPGACPATFETLTDCERFLLGLRHSTFEWMQKHCPCTQDYAGAARPAAVMFEIAAAAGAGTVVFVCDMDKDADEELRKAMLDNNKIRLFQLENPSPLANIDIKTAEAIKIHIQPTAFDFARAVSAAYRSDEHRNKTGKLTKALVEQLDRLEKFAAILDRAADFYTALSANLDERGRDFLEECHVQGVHMERMKYEILSSPELLDFIEPSMRPTVLLQARGAENIKAITDDLARVKEIIRNDTRLYTEMDRAARSVVTALRQALA